MDFEDLDFGEFLTDYDQICEPKLSEPIGNNYKNQPGFINCEKQSPFEEDLWNCGVGKPKEATLDQTLSCQSTTPSNIRQGEKRGVDSPRSSGNVIPRFVGGPSEPNRPFMFVLNGITRRYAEIKPTRKAKKKEIVPSSFNAERWKKAVRETKQVNPANPGSSGKLRAQSQARAKQKMPSNVKVHKVKVFKAPRESNQGVRLRKVAWLTITRDD
ncbi:hypothetical protein TTRE_0000556901 [Trichuris trichiura]|uniref:Uncharacterized protein n=1 Tax=Trichuris trichiura TaxID=36087 RepID=A0A077ZCL1_TRITR|nr:hypothetical protein TTRE_0000556901 [Trichuris trichiura]